MTLSAGRQNGTIMKAEMEAAPVQDEENNGKNGNSEIEKK